MRVANRTIRISMRRETKTALFLRKPASCSYSICDPRTATIILNVHLADWPERFYLLTASARGSGFNMLTFQSPRFQFAAQIGKNAGFLDWSRVRIRIASPANRLVPSRAFRSEDFHALTEFGIRHLETGFLSKSSYRASLTYQFDLLANSHPVDLPLASLAHDLTSTPFASRQNFCPALRRKHLIPVLPADSSLRHRYREFDVPRFYVRQNFCRPLPARLQEARSLRATSGFPISFVTRQPDGVTQEGGKNTARGLPPIK